jgi:hypothetical protein
MHINSYELIMRIFARYRAPPPDPTYKGKEMRVRAGKGKGVEGREEKGKEGRGGEGTTGQGE